MTINVATEFTRSGAFAIWESGSFNPQTDNGWACLVGDPEAMPQHPVFERNVTKSKHHYLFRVVLGSLVVVTNIQRMPNSRNLFSARVIVGKVTALHTRPNEKNPTHLDAESQITPLWSESFLAPKADLLAVSDALTVASPSLTGDCLNNVHNMIHESIAKSLTPAPEQHMFWGSVRESKPRKISANAGTAEQEMRLLKADPVKLGELVTASSGRGHNTAFLHMDESGVYPSEAEAVQKPDPVSEEHDGGIDPNSMSLCGLSSNPLPPLNQG